MVVTTDDVISLPYLRNEFDSNLRLQKVLKFSDGNEILSVESHRISVENNTIIIPSLPVGTY